MVNFMVYVNFTTILKKWKEIKEELANSFRGLFF